MQHYLELIRNKLLAEHPDLMQNCELIEKTLREIDVALERLGRFGHQYHLACGPCPDELASAWGPRIVWHWDGRRRLVYHPTDLAELGEGWAETLEEAKALAGKAQQFAGRGGVRSANLPALMSDLLIHISTPAEREADRKARIAAWKLERENGEK
jgi:hypothetical protein